MDSTKDDDPAGDASGQEHADPVSLADGIRELLDDGQLALRSEMAFQKARLGFTGKAGLRIAIMGVVAVLFAHGMVLALTVGLLMGLATIIGPWAATAIVAGLYLAVVGLCAVLALRKWGQIREAFSNQPDSEDTP